MISFWICLYQVFYFSILAFQKSQTLHLQTCDNLQNFSFFYGNTTQSPKYFFNPTENFLFFFYLPRFYKIAYAPIIYLQCLNLRRFFCSIFPDSKRVYQIFNFGARNNTWPFSSLSKSFCPWPMSSPTESFFSVVDQYFFSKYKKKTIILLIKYKLISIRCIKKFKTSHSYFKQKRPNVVA